MKTYLFALIFITICVLPGCTRDDENLLEPDSTTCSTINEFVNGVFQTGNKFYSTASFKFLTPGDSLYLIKQDSLLSQADIDYIFKQNRIVGEYDLSKCLQNKELVPRRINNEMNPTLGVFSISLPIYSIDKDIVVISFSYYCDGLCGYGGKYLYKKENNTWRLKIKLIEWIS